MDSGSIIHKWKDKKNDTSDYAASISCSNISVAILRRSWVIFIGQNFGPHIEQNGASLK